MPREPPVMKTVRPFNSEPYIPGRELTVSVLDGTALCVNEITSKHEFYDFDAKYAVGGSKHILPADIPEPVSLKACLWA